MRALVGLVLLVAASAGAQLGESPWPKVLQGATSLGDAEFLDFDALHFACSRTAASKVKCSFLSGTAANQAFVWTGSAWALRAFDASDFSVGASTITLGALVSKAGTCIGESTDFCSSGVDLTGTSLTQPNSTTLPATCTVGQVYVDTDAGSVLGEWECAATNTWRPRQKSFAVIGGIGGDGAFTYNGETTSNGGCTSADTTCSRTVCRCGICTGSDGSGVCTLPLNSNLYRGASNINGFVTTTMNSGVYNFSSFTLTGGTVKLTVPTAMTFGQIGGSVLILRSLDTLAISGGTIDLRDLGGQGGYGGFTAVANVGRNTAGGAGGPVRNPAAPAAGAATVGCGSSACNGASGAAAIDPRLYPFFPIVNMSGGGGGSTFTGGFQNRKAGMGSASTENINAQGNPGDGASGGASGALMGLCSCDATADCQTSSGGTCTNGRCAAGDNANRRYCAVDGDCNTSEVCGTGQCTCSPNGSNATDCGTGGVCTSGVCTAGDANKRSCNADANCNTGASRTCAVPTTGTGGNGGGQLRLESGTKISITGSTAVLDVRGRTGGNGAAGGGGGTVELIAPVVSNALSTDTTTSDPTACPAGKICVKGGPAGAQLMASQGTNGAGGNGTVLTYAGPK